MTDKILVLATCGSAGEAETIARRLVEARVAACVSIGGPVRSIYRWRGAVEDAQEWTLSIKSQAALFPALRDELRKAHSYETPEIIALPIVDGLEAYLAWIGEETCVSE